MSLTVCDESEHAPAIIDRERSVILEWRGFSHERHVFTEIALGVPLDGAAPSLQR